jgi:hypothetical protein
MRIRVPRRQLHGHAAGSNMPPLPGAAMTNHPFKIGDHVRWNSEAGHVTGKIIKVHTHDTDYKGHTHRCSEADPQYEIKSDKTDHVAMHKGAALHKID